MSILPFVVTYSTPVKRTGLTIASEHSTSTHKETHVRDRIVTCGDVLNAEDDSQPIDQDNVVVVETVDPDGPPEKLSGRQRADGPARKSLVDTDGSPPASSQMPTKTADERHYSATARSARLACVV